MNKFDELAEKIFARFIERSGFRGGWAWALIEKEPSAPAPIEQVVEEGKD